MTSIPGHVLCYDERMKSLVLVFISVFLAELGDKTQLATMLFAADKQAGKLGVFLAASAALVASTFLAVTVGDLITRAVSASTIRIAAGIGFILVGLWTLTSAAQ